MQKQLPVLFFLTVCAFLSAASPGRVRAADTIVLRNRSVERVLMHQGDSWRTTRFARANGEDAVLVQSDEFLIKLMDGKELTAADYRATAAPAVSKNGTLQTIEIRYTPRPGLPADAPQSVMVEYQLSDTPYLRKRLRLTLPPQGAIDRLEVEHFQTAIPCDRGGRGEPVFLGKSWFMGLEYPGSETSCGKGMVALAHFPGLAHELPDRTWTIESKTAVAGVGKKGDPLELAFSDYVDTIRRPARSFLHYNSWFDFRGKEINPPNILSTYEAFQKNLLEPFGLKMDAMVPDDGWQNPNSIWVPHSDVYPNGFKPLAQALEAHGTRLGLWLPLNGTNLNIAWGVEQGYEKSNQGNYYCLVGPKYNAALRDVLKTRIQDGNITYFKHDFNNLRCTAPDHGHLPDDRHGHEASLDAELDLLAYERQLQPGIFLNITSNVWFSPWWLMHADSIWMAADDFGYDKTWPQLSPREWDMSYRDHHLYKMYTTERHLVPASALMTHGIIRGRYNNLGGADETLREWSDQAVMYYGRGVQLKELYITPSMIPTGWWKPLGDATRWAVDNAKLLNQVIMVGGDPAKGQVYGYAHFLGERGLLVLRNPDLAEQSITIPMDGTVRYRGPAGQKYRARVIYPSLEDLHTQYVSGKPLRFAVPGATVMVVELQPGAAPALKTAQLTSPITASATVDPQGSKISGSVEVPKETMQRLELILVRKTTPGDAPLRGQLTVDLNGHPAAARTASGPGWQMFSVDLRGLAGQRADWSVPLPGGSSDPFGSGGGTTTVWLVADRPVGTSVVTTEHLPSYAANGFRRETTRLLNLESAPRAVSNRKITAADLRTAKAGLLRVSLFGTDGGAAYRNKSILLNGQKLALIPATNQDEWQTRVIELKPEQLGLLQMGNTVQLENAGGDSYKFSGVQLAVQLADGTWTATARDPGVYCSAAEWAFSEGKIFKDNKSDAISLSFPAG